MNREFNSFFTNRLCIQIKRRLNSRRDLVKKMNNFLAMVLDKVNDQTKLEFKQLSMDDLPEGEVTWISGFDQ